MRVSIIVTDDDSNTFQGDAELSASRPSKSTTVKKKPWSQKPSNVSATVNLSSPIRPFMKNHAHGMGGPQKVTLLLAHVAKGDTKEAVALATIQEQWNKMKGILSEADV